ncbi:hypothetical protein LPJ58_001045 [Coemansia sp. RSA 1591]|nr:hypothetical protein LPJ58_001045 [Coemansia sp. RSA 1591]KAJ1766193.1 hypothetical protein LPJ69_000969 [Coemansia sp. RSA 1752]
MTLWLIGIPIVFGVGVGLAMQPMMFCAQNSGDQQGVAATTTLFMTIRMLFSAIGLAIAQSVMQNDIMSLLKVIAARFPDQANVVYNIVSNQSVIWEYNVPIDVRDAVTEAYVKSTHKVYLVFMAFGSLTFIVSLFSKNLKLCRNLGDAAAE